MVELEGAAHTRAEGGVLELAVGPDLGDDAGEGEGGGLEVDGGGGEEALWMLAGIRGGRGTRPSETTLGNSDGRSCRGAEPRRDRRRPTSGLH